MLKRASWGGLVVRMLFVRLSLDDTSYWEEAPEQTQNMAERLYISSGLGMSQDEEMEKVVGDRDHYDDTYGTGN